MAEDYATVAELQAHPEEVRFDEALLALEDAAAYEVETVDGGRFLVYHHAQDGDGFVCDMMDDELTPYSTGDDLEGYLETEAADTEVDTARTTYYVPDTSIQEFARTFDKVQGYDHTHVRAERTHRFEHEKDDLTVEAYGRPNGVGVTITARGPGGNAAFPSLLMRDAVPESYELVDEDGQPAAFTDLNERRRHTPDGIWGFLDRLDAEDADFFSVGLPRRDVPPQER